MSNATNEQTPRKRTRISDDVQIIANVNNNKKHEFNIYRGPLASLQPVIRPIADAYFTKLSDLFNNHVNNQAKLKKFDDVNFIPKSCRVHFTAGASTLVKGSTDYSDLLAQIDNKNKETASSHRDTVKKVVQLKLNASLTTLRDTFCECLFKLSTMFMNFYFFRKEIPSGQIHKLSKDIISNEPRIIHYIFEADINAFTTWYNKKYNITLATVAIDDDNTAPAAAAAASAQAADPIILSLLPNGSRDIADYNLSVIEEGQYAYAEYDNPGSGLDSVLANRRRQYSESTQATTASLNALPFSVDATSQASTVSLNELPFSVNTNTHPTQHTQPTQPTQPTQAPQGIPHYILPALQRDQYSLLMLNITYNSWSVKLNLHEEKLRNAELAKLATTLLTSDITNDVAMTIAAQPPASEAIINDLINAKFNELKKAIYKDNAKSNHGNAKAKTKNNKRGETSTRASNPKKSKKTPTKKTPTKKPPDATRSTRNSKQNNKSKPSPKKSSASKNSSTPRRNPRKNRGGTEQGTTNARNANNSTSNPQRGTNNTKRSKTPRPSGQRKGTKNTRSSANAKR
jgi:hypothetical protein